MFESMNKTKERIKPNKNPFEDGFDLKIERKYNIIENTVEEYIVNSDNKRFTREQYATYTWLTSVYDLEEYENDFLSFLKNNGFIVNSGNVSYIPKTKEFVLICLIDICEIPAEVILDELRLHISTGSYESISKRIKDKIEFDKLVEKIKVQSYV